MKKLALAVSTICMCFALLFSVNASASYTIVAPQTLPYTYNGHTYTDVISVYWASQGYTKMVYYNPSELTNLRLDYQGGGYSYFVGNTNNSILYRQYNQQTLNYENQGGMGFAIPINSSSTLTSTYVISSQDVLAYQTENFNGYQGLGSVSQNQVLMSPNWQSGQTRQLTIVPSPLAGGTVTSDPSSIDCPDTSCQANFTINSDVDITATAETDWAFAYWDNGTTNLYSNPLTVTMDSAKTLTAKFFGTFRNAVGDFRQSSGSGDECVLYVRSETDILYEACHGEAADCFSQAQTAGYATSTTVPRIGSIIVFNRASGALSSGHVGIVTNINGTEITMQDSNWVAYHTIENHTVDVSGYSIAGYIYYTP